MRWLAALLAGIALLAYVFLQPSPPRYRFPVDPGLPPADREELGRLVDLQARLLEGGAATPADRDWLERLLRERRKLVRPIQEGIHREWVYEAVSRDGGRRFQVLEKPLMRGSVPAAARLGGRTLVYAVAPGIDASVDYGPEAPRSLDDLGVARLAAALAVPMTAGLAGVEDRGDGVWRPLIVNVVGRPKGVSVLDPEILHLGDRLRMYYFGGKEGEPWGPQGPVDVAGVKNLYSLVSTDGVTWTQEEGVRLADSHSVADPTVFWRGEEVVLLQGRRVFVSRDRGWTFERVSDLENPSQAGFGTSVVHLPGGYRAWFSTLSGIVSASSQDARTWTPEGVALPGVADPAAVTPGGDEVRLFFKVGGEYQVKALLRQGFGGPPPEEREGPAP